MPRRESTRDEVDWAERNAHLLLQRSGFSRGEAVRDSSKAANVEWIKRRLPKHSKIVLWAHNSSVARAKGTMGEWLGKRFGNDMVVIGLATNEGQCTMTKTTSSHLEATPIQSGPEGSFEALAWASGIPRFLLDLRRTGPRSRIAAQFAGGLSMRSIGVLTPEQEFWPSAVSRENDVIAWAEKTQATRSLH